jgi:hypothetical protein
MPVTLARIVGGGEGVCCPCPNMSGCSCDAHCRIECRAGNGGDGGIATLCGFSELVDATVPPKKYRHREIVNVVDDPFIQCTERGAACEPDGACPGSLSLAYTGPFPGSPYDIEVVGSLVLAGVAGGIATYVGAGISARQLSTPPTPLAARIVAGGLGVFTNGVTHSVAVDTECPVGLEVDFIEFTQVDSGCITAGHPSGSKIADHWDLQEDYIQNPASNTCGLLQTDNSTRQTGAECDGPLLTTAALPCADPPTCYGGGVAVLSEAPAVRVWQGVGCVQTALDYYTTYDEMGTIKEELGTEDTEADAINRALHTSEGIAIPLEAVPNCAENPAFITLRNAGEFSFGFRKVEVRAKLVDLNPALLTPPRSSADYNVRIYIHRRLIASGGPFLFFAVLEVTAHVVQDNVGTPLVDESITYTPWFEIPNEAGWETRAEYCTAELIP